ncbi:hypothetical protein OG402_41055 [Streptomyces anulatus]|uniref:hypothetical protein n=1 Tax=Streptomyces anulatus TaxID=1892 RepID=UPI00225B2D54|nr:hypothetical protein [Streptomyces anulatus]MCX4606818.1 hypothetical protein [Streptomyces anulatus]
MATAPPATYHWIATIATAKGAVKTEDGTVTVTPHVDTHSDTYGLVLDRFEQKYGTGCTVMFFSLTPDQL